MGGGAEHEGDDNCYGRAAVRAPWPGGRLAPVSSCPLGRGYPGSGEDIWRPASSD